MSGAVIALAAIDQARGGQEQAHEQGLRPGPREHHALGANAPCKARSPASHAATCVAMTWTSAAGALPRAATRATCGSGSLLETTSPTERAARFQ